MFLGLERERGKARGAEQDGQTPPQVAQMRGTKRVSGAGVFVSVAGSVPQRRHALQNVDAGGALKPFVAQPAPALGIRPQSLLLRAWDPHPGRQRGRGLVLVGAALLLRA